MQISDVVEEKTSVGELKKEDNVFKMCPVNV